MKKFLICILFALTSNAFSQEKTSFEGIAQKEMSFNNAKQYELIVTLYNGTKIMNKTNIEVLSDIPEELSSYKLIEYTKAVSTDDKTGQIIKEKAIAKDGYSLKSLVSSLNQSNLVSLKVKANISKIISGEKLFIGKDDNSFIDLYNLTANQTATNAVVKLNEETTVLTLNAIVTKENLINKSYTPSNDWKITIIVK